ncbi:MAG: 50S ribosomal protein L22, partial [Thaumarchaeota archaeon]|nr:50S ribosomal protein L22 [Nitrososphaerota archaeon]
NVSPKFAREVCTAIKGMMLHQAQSYLEKVMKLEAAVPYRRYKKKVGHRSNLFEFNTGGYPVKAAKTVLGTLRNLEANAEFKGFDAERIILQHASASRGRVIKDFVPRAFGRSSPNYHVLVHIELVGRES